MSGKIWRLSLLLIVAVTGFSQNTPPQEICEFDQERAGNEVRLITGNAPMPYYFACQERNPNADATGCIKGKTKPGLVVSVNRSKDGWDCVSGIDSTSGWVQPSSLKPLPEEPRISLKRWEGWWEHPSSERAKGRRNDRLLITRGREPGSLRVSGRAYWHGTGDVVHYGQVNGEASPMGYYLHVVEGRCVLDLEFASSNPAELQVHQNEFEAGACGGANVSFSGKWIRFTPPSTKRPEDR